MTAFTETPWPEGVVARYLTVAAEILRDPNLTVDVTHDELPHWSCQACPGSSYGAYTGPFGDALTLPTIHEQAQDHASKCRAMARPA